ncbi:hypothetical protein K0M31_009556 [Melipona bicolor]|uniref:Uncharacterized protein n=1 Tax=Melipona bicolor TaxID=60889 RepID=A0AA40FP37_9HYME|nr:hypothetical protein K0M31_009556 [Melipona bicolor]
MPREISKHAQEEKTRVEENVRSRVVEVQGRCREEKKVSEHAVRREGGGWGGVVSNVDREEEAFDGVRRCSTTVNAARREREPAGAEGCSGRGSRKDEKRRGRGRGAAAEQCGEVAGQK